MNHVYRVIFNRALGTRVAVPEIGRARRGGSRRATSARVAAGTLCLFLCHGLTFAAGGAGGQGASPGDVANPGGAGGTEASPNGQNGTGASLATGNSGSGGGGGEASRTAIQGGAGGLGGAGIGALSGGGNGGRAGDAGAIRSGPIATELRGLDGMAGSPASGGGGGGGAGGVGLIVAPAGTATIGTGVLVIGGFGGNGGRSAPVATVDIPAGSGGSGGDGGNGVHLANGTTLINGGEIRGGAAGFGGAPGIVIIEKVNAVGGAAGTPGAAIEADGATILNGGAIIGGAPTVIGGAAGRAIFFRSGANRLELRAGSQVQGLVDIAANASALVAVTTLGQTLDGGVRVNGAGVFDTGGFDATILGAISGSGSLTKTGDGTLLLGAPASFDGSTSVTGGTLRAGATNAFGATGQTTVGAGAALDLGGYSQRIGSLAGSGAVRFGSVNAQTPAGGPTLAVAGNGLDSVFGGRIEGNGHLFKVGSGTLTLGASNDYLGATRVEQGRLRAGVADAFSAASAHAVAAGATLDTGGFDQRLASLSNAGTVSLLGAAPGSTLTVRGAYVGDGGVLRLGTRLGDSASATDRLVLDGVGASASGSTSVQVVNFGGLGAATRGDGIELIGARNGASTTAQTSKNAFSLAGEHVDAGAFEYRLHAADANGAGESWFLRSTVAAAAGAGAAGSGGAPGAPGAFESTAGLAALGGGVVPAYRVEVPLFSALPQQLREADLGMLTNRAQRIGDEIDDAAGGPRAQPRQAWGRVISLERQVRQGGTVMPSSEGRFAGWQAGTDLWAEGAWHAGVYAGQLDGDMRVKGFAGGVPDRPVGRTEVKSQHLGGYATWVGSGFFADAVLQLGRHRFEVEPAGRVATHGTGQSVLASLEVGKSFDLGPAWKIEPQLQLVRQRLSLDDAVIPRARVVQDAEDGWLVRAGVRLVGDQTLGGVRVMPYGRLNVYRASGGRDTATFVGAGGATAIQAATGALSTEAAAGFTLALGAATTVYAELGKRWASGGDARLQSSVQGGLGLRVRW